jgi:hypothetical protein
VAHQRNVQIDLIASCDEHDAAPLQALMALAVVAKFSDGSNSPGFHPKPRPSAPADLGRAGAAGEPRKIDKN